jgi:hypothetical protein
MIADWFRSDQQKTAPVRLGTHTGSASGFNDSLQCARPPTVSRCLSFSPRSTIP